jgi:hypothetical protein
MRIAEMCQGVQVGKVFEVKAYTCLPWISRLEVRILENVKQA